MHSLRLLLGSAVLTFLLPHAAWAQDAVDHGPTTIAPAPVASSPQVSRLGAFMRASAVEARASRRTIVISGLATGAALVPTGIVLWNRPAGPR